jgi:hypothetical protein
MFSNAQAVLNTNRVLLNQVRARVGQWDAHSRLGDVFLRIADFFKIYIEYANNYDAAHEQLDQLIDSSEAFVRFCEAMELRDGLDLGLEDLLIMPVQRLPRYVMLLESLLKYTPAVHPDREALTSAVTKIQEISQQINDTNFEVEQRRRVFEIHQARHVCARSRRASWRRTASSGATPGDLLRPRDVEATALPCVSLQRPAAADQRRLPRLPRRPACSR